MSTYKSPKMLTEIFILYSFQAGHIQNDNDLQVAI